jgi:tetratricopeptide (TPR) repeat protein
MSRSNKVFVFVGLGICALIFAWSFAVDLNHVLHKDADASLGRMIAALIALLAVLGVLGVLCFSHFSGGFGRRAELFSLESADPGVVGAQLEEADKLRKRGESLEAIRLLRDFLQEHPAETDLMSRIAEIYNYDLRNYLAAALEYEELLKRKISDEDWGWAALHLAKLYGRLNDPDKAVALLQRLDDEYGHTLAARRARKVREQHDTDSDEAEPSTDPT